MSSLQPSVQPGLPADLSAQPCQSDEANFPTEGRRRCARFFVPSVRAWRQQHKAKEKLACILISPPKLPWGSWEWWGACGEPELIVLSTFSVPLG